MPCSFWFGDFRCGNTPWFYRREEKASGKVKMGEFKANSFHLRINKIYEYNSEGLALVLLKYKQDLSNEN